MGYFFNKKTETSYEKDALTGVHILLVEDEEMVNRMYARMLKKAGANVDIAYDGHQAASLLINSAPDVILLDLMMPRVNGYEFLRSIRSMEKMSHIPVIIVSNMSNRPNDVKKLAELGISDFLTKSDITLEDLIERIKAYIRKTS